MDYEALLDLATELGYQLAISGAETFRVEESIVRILDAYRSEDYCSEDSCLPDGKESFEKNASRRKFGSLKAQAFSIPNCLIVSIRTPKGESLTRMRRVGFHGNDLDAVEQFSNLSRRICRKKPDINTLNCWIEETKKAQRTYRFLFLLLGSCLAAGGFCMLFGGSFQDAFCSGICGVIITLVGHFLDRFRTNPFFKTILASFVMAIPAYAMGVWGIADNSDAVVIGALMLLVPGLLFTNAMRDIIYGDTNSGLNRIVQVFLTAAAIALGVGAAWNFTAGCLGTALPDANPGYPYLIQAAACFIGCAGFSILFNIHGLGLLICCLGGMLSWSVYCFTMRSGISELTAYFFATAFAAVYSEMMARIRKFPTIAYLVVSIFPMIPGAGVYYTMNYIVQGEMSLVAEQGLYTIAIAGLMAVAILMVSSVVRLCFYDRMKRGG